jgi:hypothetical protein
VPLNIIQRQLGHANLGTTSTCKGSIPKDHHGGAHAARADDVRQRRAAALIESWATTSGSAVALPLGPGEASVRPAGSRRVVLVRSRDVVAIGQYARKPTTAEAGGPDVLVPESALGGLSAPWAAPSDALPWGIYFLTHP